MNIVLIGAGNVAFHLGPILNKNGHKIIQLYSRSLKNTRPLAKILKCQSTTSPKGLLPDADIYLIALSDNAIAPFLEKLSFIPRLIVHTSGSIGLDVFPAKIKNAGVLYPVQTFSKSSKSDPEKIPFCIEGRNPKALSVIRQLAKSISNDVYKVNSSDRRYIHLSAVFANNFTNYLFTRSAKILKQKKISFNILKPLIQETAQKVQHYSPDKILTGPARRGDFSIIKKHLMLLNEFPELKDIYNRLSKSISKEYGPRL